VPFRVCAYVCTCLSVCMQICCIQKFEVSNFTKLNYISLCFLEWKRCVGELKLLDSPGMLPPCLTVGSIKHLNKSVEIARVFSAMFAVQHSETTLKNKFKSLKQVREHLNEQLKSGTNMLAVYVDCLDSKNAEISFYMDWTSNFFITRAQILSVYMYNGKIIDSVNDSDTIIDATATKMHVYQWVDNPDK
jgi:hypothetical protein